MPWTFTWFRVTRCFIRVSANEVTWN
jgi:hypothetical protein